MHKRQAVTILKLGLSAFAITYCAIPPEQEAVSAIAPVSSLSLPPAVAEPQAESQTVESADIFEGGIESVAARAIGHAEGNLTANGTRTSNYAGHTDPGNKRQNLGMFSWQVGGCKTPEDCDQLGLKRLLYFEAQLSTIPGGTAVLANDEALLSYLDLSIQAPLAAADFPKLYEQHGDILTARYESFRDPATGQLDTTLNGKGIATLEDDQRRRMDAIARVLGLQGD